MSNSFRFVVRAPMSRAATLFGPDGERGWAGEDWDPKFLHPQPGRDVQGAVFSVQHGPHKSVWVNTVFNQTEGRMQYVAFIPDTMVSTVDVRLTPIDRATTTVEVTYVRTSLDTAADDHVQSLGRSDREAGPHWREAIEAYLNGQPGRR